MWSIAEYVDHVRETMFVMRFVLDVAVATPGTDLGHPSPPPLGPRRDLDVTVVLQLFGEEVAELCRRLGEVPAADLDSAVVLGARSLDGHWVVRNALHEAMHHLGDVRRLAAAAVIDASPPNPVGRLPAGPPASPG